jgi:glycosyltransferase involved in cell wall biosynthesis
VRVSIITGVHNGESDVVRTLGSVAAQDYENIEHIIINGDLRDATLALVQQHGSRVARWIWGRDPGVYDAFNKGLRIATGDVVAFLIAGDEYLDRSVVSRMVHHATRPVWLTIPHTLAAFVGSVFARSPAMCMQIWSGPQSTAPALSTSTSLVRSDLSRASSWLAKVAAG